MLNTSESLGNQVRRDIVEKYGIKLRTSGYSIVQTRKVIISGLKCYEKKVLNSKNTDSGGLHVDGKSSANMRFKKKILEKTRWFKPRKVENVKVVQTNGSAAINEGVWRCGHFEIR